MGLGLGLGSGLGFGFGFGFGLGLGLGLLDGVVAEGGEDLNREEADAARHRAEAV